MEENLNNQIVKGVSWNLIETAVSYLVRFVIGIILARLLMPSDFGLIGMTAVFIAVSDIFVRAGFGQAFIRKENVTSVDADTVFYINLTVGLLIYLLLFLTAPLIAAYFNEPKLVDIVRVLSLVVVLNSFNVIQYALIRRHMLYKRKAVVTILSSMISGVAGVLCAYKGMGVWSLVVQQLVSRVILCLLFYHVSDWRPGWSFSKDIARSMFSFGSWLLLADLIAAFMNNFYRIIIGRFYSSEELGYYDRAHQFQSMVADTFTWALGIVAFPSFTRFQRNIGQMNVLVEKYVRYSTILIYPVLCIMAVTAKPMIALLLTEKWLPAVPYLQLFCVVGLVVPLNFFLCPFLQAAGFPKIALYSTLFLAVMRILNVCAVAGMGVKALLVGETIALSLNIIVFSVYASKKSECDYFLALKGVWGSLLASAAAVAAGILLVSRPFASDILRLVSTASLMSVIYVVVIWLADRRTVVAGITYLRKLV